MGWRLVVMCGLLLGGASRALADDQPTVVESPSNAYLTFKKVVDVLNPQIEELYDLDSKEWRHGVSASLWNFTSNDVYLASARVGYSFDQEPLDDEHKLVYGGLKLDIPGIVTRLTPDAWESAIGGVGFVRSTIGLLGKYAAVGAFVGRDLSVDDTAYGFTLGGRVTW